MLNYNEVLKMRNNISYRVTTSGLLVALGLLLPFATAHAFGVPGN